MDVVDSKRKKARLVLRTWKVTEADFNALDDLHTQMKRTPGAGKVNQWDVISFLLHRFPHVDESKLMTVPDLVQKGKLIEVFPT